MIGAELFKRWWGTPSISTVCAKARDQTLAASAGGLGAGHSTYALTARTFRHVQIVPSPACGRGRLGGSTTRMGEGSGAPQALTQ